MFHCFWFFFFFTDSPPVSTNCDRICKPGDTKTCVFTWNVSYYYSLTNDDDKITNRPCGNCPFDIADCYRNECIPLNGLKRPLVTVNRQVPGPKIVVSTKYYIHCSLVFIDFFPSLSWFFQLLGLFWTVALCIFILWGMLMWDFCWSGHTRLCCFTTLLSGSFFQRVIVLCLLVFVDCNVRWAHAFTHKPQTRSLEFHDI